MAHVLERLPDNKVKLTVTIPADELDDKLDHAAEHISEEVKIPGFRPGKAPFDVVERHVGAQAILEHAAEELVRETFVAAMLEEDLSTVGQPFFSFVKLAKGNDFVYTAEMALMPTVTKLADYDKLEVAKVDTEPTAEILEQTKKDLARMQTKEVRATSGHKLEKGNKAVVNLTMKKDGVILEGGESKNHGVFTDEPHYIEGFVDNILGMAEGEEKNFTLKFPTEHYQKHLAGQDVDFTVKMNEIFQLESPVIDDAFAAKLGMKDTAELEEKLKENLRKEGEYEEARRQDKAVLDAIADKSTFDAIPDLLVNQEIDKMVHELEHNIEEQGMDFKQYLSSIGKSMTDIKMDFTAPALQRIKVSIVLNEIAKREKVTVDAAELDKELDMIASRFDEKNEARKRVYEPEYREYVERQMINRKTIDLLKSKIVK